MTFVTPPRDAQRGAPLRIAAITLLIAALMYAVIGHFAQELDRTRLEQIRIAEIDRRAATAAHDLDDARLGDGGIPSNWDRDAMASAFEKVRAFEDRATIVGLIEASDLLLASVDLQTKHLRAGDGRKAAVEARVTDAAQARLHQELAALDVRCQKRAKAAIEATGLSVLGALLLSAAFVSFFATRHERRTVSLAALEVQGRLSEAREHRSRLLLDVEEATGDLMEPERVVATVMGLLEAFLGVSRCAYERIDRGGRTIDPAGGGLPPLDAQDLATLRAGRPRIADALVRCPLMRNGDLRAVVSARSEASRLWSHDEVAMVEEVAARCAAYLERAEAEAAKAQSRWNAAVLDAQVNSSVDGILIVDPQHRRILQNRRMAEVWGLPEDVIDDEDDDRQFALILDTVVDPDAFIAPFAPLREDPQASYRGEIALKSGTVLERYSGPAVGLDGTVYGRIWTFRDVTDRIRAEQALREAHDGLEARVERRTHDLAAATLEAERANAAKSEFLSRMSHELRTPLNAILGFGQILERQKLDALQKESVHYILKGGRHLLGLINEVLDISRVETGHAELSIEPVPLADVLVESFAMVRTMAADRDVRLEEDFDALGELHLVADRQRLKQVLINLLSNAVKYNRPGGTVAARCVAEDGRLRIAIEDTGLGISPEGLAKLFVPFERLDAAATGVEGTGLGLFLTQKLVTTMGGRMEVESVLGRGTVFTIDLELARSPSELLLLEGGLPEPEPEEDGNRTYSILSIEDNSANVRLLETVFAHRPNIQLAAVSQGMAGLERARKVAPDLILLDLNLPDVSGTEVLTRLKRSATTRDIPVIVVSADASPEKVAENLRAGAAEFLAKPLDVDRFLRIVDATLRNRPTSLKEVA